MTVVRCDECGNVVDEWVHLTISHQVNGDEVTKFTDRTSMDLCLSCHGSISVFLRQRKQR